MCCRYYLVEKAKDANIIGILVGTLGVGKFLFFCICVVKIDFVMSRLISSLNV